MRETSIDVQAQLKALRLNGMATALMATQIPPPMATSNSPT